MPSTHSKPSLLILLLCAPLLLCGSLLLCCCVWLLCTPVQSLPVQLSAQVNTGVLVASMVGGTVLVVVGVLGTMAAIRQERCLTALVTILLSLLSIIPLLSLVHAGIAVASTIRVSYHYTINTIPSSGTLGHSGRVQRKIMFQKEKFESNSPQ